MIFIFIKQKNVGDTKAKHDGLLKSMLSFEESIKAIVIILQVKTYCKINYFFTKFNNY